MQKMLTITKKKSDKKNYYTVTAKNLLADTTCMRLKLHISICFRSLNLRHQDSRIYYFVPILSNNPTNILTEFDWIYVAGDASQKYKNVSVQAVCGILLSKQFWFIYMNNNCNDILMHS